MAASAAGSAVGGYVGEQLKGSTLFNDWSKTAADFARGTIRGFAAGTAAAIAQGGRISIQQAATDAFGNALGESLASLNQPTSSIYSLASDDRASLGLLPGNGEPNLRLGGAAGLSYGEQRAIPSFGINTQNLDSIGSNGYLSSMYAAPKIIYQGVNSQGLRYDYYDSDVRATEVISHNILKPVALSSISLDNAPTFNTDISVASPSGDEYIQGAAQLVLGGTYNQTVRICSALASIPYAILSGVDTAVGVQNILQTNYSYTPDSPGAEAILGKLAPTVAYVQSNISAQLARFPNSI